MKTFSTTAGRDPAGPSNRRQPVRQTRTNPLRASTTVQASTAVNLRPQEDIEPTTPRFYPALTHFTDAITALPKEMVRHYTMLKEVDAKIYGPEELLGQLFTTALKMPTPRFGQGPPVRDTVRMVGGAGTQKVEVSRQELYHHMRYAMGTTLAILDEKNHVMNTAVDALDKQLKRCQSSYPYIEEEISEEARYGSMTHWAYTDKTSEKKGIIAGERTRRAAQEAEGAAVRSELRREAVAARKGRVQHVDSDFDDTRTTGRKGQLGAKGRKVMETSYAPNGVGLGISHAAGPPAKRRKTEKAALGSLPMERGTSQAYPSHTGSTKSIARDQPESNVKKSKAAVTTNGSNRRRGNTNASALESAAASSPTMGSFTTTAKDRQGRSPAPTSMQRIPSARARPNSSQNNSQTSRNRSNSTNQKNGNGTGGTLYGTTADVEKVSGLTGRSVGEVKGNMKEAINSKGEHLIEDVGGNDGTVEMRGALVVNSRANNDRGNKKDESEPQNGSRGRAERPASISTRGGGSKAPSANPTPHATTFGEQQQKSRATGRTSELPVKRSHKKGAGLAAQLAAAEAAREEEGSPLQGDEDEEEGENEPRYCYCDGVSYGEMVGCDAEDCRREWFHLQCVGLTKAPAKNAKWYCDECKDKVKKQKFNGGNGR